MQILPMYWRHSSISVSQRLDSSEICHLIAKASKKSMTHLGDFQSGWVLHRFTKALECQTWGYWILYDLFLSRLFIIPEFSATLGFAGEVRVSLNWDHSTIVKYVSDQDNNYRVVSELLWIWFTKHATKNLMWKRKCLFSESYLFDLDESYYQTNSGINF